MVGVVYLVLAYNVHCICVVYFTNLILRVIAIFIMNSGIDLNMLEISYQKSDPLYTLYSKSNNSKCDL